MGGGVKSSFSFLLPFEIVFFFYIDACNGGNCLSGVLPWGADVCAADDDDDDDDEGGGGGGC